jgi:hypothetical protein
MIPRCWTTEALKPGGRNGSGSTRRYVIARFSEDRRRAESKGAVWGFGEVTHSESSKDASGVCSYIFNKTALANSPKQAKVEGVPPVRDPGEGRNQDPKSKRRDDPSKRQLLSKDLSNLCQWNFAPHGLHVSSVASRVKNDIICGS